MTLIIIVDRLLNAEPVSSVLHDQIPYTGYSFSTVTS